LHAAPQQQQQQQPDAPPPLVLQPIDSNVPPCHIPDKSSGAGSVAAAGKTGSQPSRNSQGGSQPKQLAGPQSGAGQSGGGQEQPRGTTQVAITSEAVTAAVVAQQVPLVQHPGSQGQDAQQQLQGQQGPDRLSGAGAQAQQLQEPCQQAPGVPPSHSEQPSTEGAPAGEPPPPALPVRDGSSDEGQEQLAAELAELMARLPRGAAPVAPLVVTASQLDPLLVAGLSAAAATAAAAGRSNPGSAANTPRAARPPLAGGGGGRPPAGPAPGAGGLAGAGASSALVSGGVSHNSGSDFGSKGQVRTSH
jgi:hypothetical protein